MTELIIIFLSCFIARLAFDKLWLIKFKTINWQTKVISTSIPMVIIGIWLAIHLEKFWQWIVFAIIISSLWSLLFDPIRNLINGHKWNYVSDKWPDSFIYKYFNTPYLFIFFRLIVIVMGWGLINNINLKTKKDEKVKIP